MSFQTPTMTGTPSSSTSTVKRYATRGFSPALSMYSKPAPSMNPGTNPAGAGPSPGSSTVPMTNMVAAITNNTFSTVIRQIENPTTNAQAGTGIGFGAGANASSLTNDQTFIDDAAERIAAFNLKKQELDADPYWQWLTHVAGTIGGQSAYMFLSDDAKKIFTANDHVRLAHLVHFVSTPELHLLASGSGSGSGSAFGSGPGSYISPANVAHNPCPLKASVVMQTRMAYVDIQRSLANRKLSVPPLIDLVRMQRGDMSVVFASMVGHKLRFAEANEQNESKLDATMARAGALVAQDIQMIVSLAKDAEGVSDRTQYYAAGGGGIYAQSPQIYDKLAYLF